MNAIKAYLQKDSGNTWQAESQIISYPNTVIVDVVDWGDNLESVPWYLTSQVRIETVLYKNDVQMLEYGMRHLYGWGIDEMHGLATDAAVAETILSEQATVYSPCARLTIQKLTVPREQVTNIVWDPSAAAWTGEVRPPIFNKAVHEAADGLGYYSAEINVKGKIIYGYTWNVRTLNDAGAGDYRITFSLDGSGGMACGAYNLNTNLASASILMPVEEVTAADLAATATASAVSVAAEDGGTDGGVAIIDPANNLTYIDIRILPQRGGGGR